MDKLAYGLFMAEASGYLNTREGKLQKIIRILKAYPEREISNSTFKRICEANDIDPDDFTERDLRRIQRAIK